MSDTAVISTSCSSSTSYCSPSKPTCTSPPLFLTDDQVAHLLDWKTLIPAIEGVMIGVARAQVIQPARLLMSIPERDAVVLSMPGYIKASDDTKTDDSLAVKIVTAFTRNKEHGLPSVLATVLFYNSTTGKLKAVMEAAEITKWRTAGASVVATKHLFKRSQNKGLTLAIMGSGAQADIHARAFAENFDIKKVNIWNHRYPGAQALVSKLRLNPAIQLEAFESGEDAVRDADIIVTATYAGEPVVKFEWIKKTDVHINAVGAGVNHYSELDSALYGNASIFFDTEASARTELKGLYEQFPQNMIGEVGQYIEKLVKPDERYKLTVFHSMGMASEDVITAKLIYDKYMKQKSSPVS